MRQTQGLDASLLEVVIVPERVRLDPARQSSHPFQPLGIQHDRRHAGQRRVSQRHDSQRVHLRQQADCDCV